VNDGNQAEPIPADIEHDIAVYGIGVLEHASNLGEIVPSHILDNPHPGKGKRGQPGWGGLFFGKVSFSKQ
jgi:hypothetical protein